MSNFVLLGQLGCGKVVPSSCDMIVRVDSNKKPCGALESPSCKKWAAKPSVNFRRGGRQERVGYSRMQGEIVFRSLCCFGVGERELVWPKADLCRVAVFRMRGGGAQPRIGLCPWYGI